MKKIILAGFAFGGFIIFIGILLNVLLDHFMPSLGRFIIGFGFFIAAGSILLAPFVILQSVWTKNRESVFQFTYKLRERTGWRLFKVLYIIGSCIVFISSVASSLDYYGSKQDVELFGDFFMALLLIGGYFVIRRLTVYVLHGV